MVKAKRGTPRDERAINVQRRAVRVAEESGALSNAGLAALIEEQGAGRGMSQAELYDLYRRADRLLKDTQDAGDVARLRACASIVMWRLTGIQRDDQNFTLFSAVHEWRPSSSGGLWKRLEVV